LESFSPPLGRPILAQEQTMAATATTTNLENMRDNFGISGTQVKQQNYSRNTGANQQCRANVF
jgi:hypothetical protein